MEARVELIYVSNAYTQPETNFIQYFKNNVVHKTRFMHEAEFVILFLRQKSKIIIIMLELKKAWYFLIIHISEFQLRVTQPVLL